MVRGHRGPPCFQLAAGTLSMRASAWAAPDLEYPRAYDQARWILGQALEVKQRANISHAFRRCRVASQGDLHIVHIYPGYLSRGD
jgi:hypothetical protein